MSSSQTKEEEIKSFLTDTIGMSEEDVEEQADEMVENDEVLLRVNAYEKIKENNVAQPQEETEIEGAYLGSQARTNNDGEVTGYVTWVFSSSDHAVVRVNSDTPLVDETSEPRQFSQITLDGVERWENLEDGYSWLQATDSASAEFEDGNLQLDLVFDYAQTVGEVDEDATYLVIADIEDVDMIGEFNDETDDFDGWKPVIEDEDTSNLRLVLSEPRTGEQATIKVKDPRDLAALTGIDLDRLMKIGAQKDPQEMRQQINQVLEGEEVVVFGRGSAYIEGEEVQDGDGNRRPWMTLSNFDIGFIESLDELEAEA